MARLHRLVPVLALLSASSALAKDRDPSLGAGTSLTVGSRGYVKYALFGDADWTGTRFDPKLDPYAWTQFGVDNFLWQLGVGGGAWKNLSDDFRVKGGLGVNLGHVHDSDDTANSFVLETGAEKDIQRSKVGAEYRLTTGAIGGPSVPSVNDQNVRDRVRGRSQVASVSAPSYTYSELSAYGWTPAGKTKLGLRLTLGLPSYSQSIVSETLTWKVPVTKPLTVYTALTLEQGTSDNVYFTGGLYYSF